jgi:hypothetical protein
LKFDDVTAHHLDPPQPHPLAIAQLIHLPRLRTKHSAQVVRGFAFHPSALLLKSFHKESTSHLASILPRNANPLNP